MKKHRGDLPACVDCLHYGSTGVRYGSSCLHDECSSFDPVKGREPVQARTARVDGVCGPRGILFEPVPPPTWLDRHIMQIMLFSLVAGFAVWIVRSVIQSVQWAHVF